MLGVWFHRRCDSPQGCLRAGCHPQAALAVVTLAVRVVLCCIGLPHGSLAPCSCASHLIICLLDCRTGGGHAYPLATGVSVTVGSSLVSLQWEDRCLTTLVVWHIALGMPAGPALPSQRVALRLLCCTLKYQSIKVQDVVLQPHAMSVVCSCCLYVVARCLRALPVTLWM